jgi:hypothetical protein
MKNLIKIKPFYHASIYNKLLIITKQIFAYLLIILILVFYYYICTCLLTYNFSNYNDELTTICTISFEELKPVNNNQPNIWYKYLLDDFFNKFTSNSKTIKYKIIEVKSDIKTLMPLELEHDINKVNKPVILNKIQSDCIKSLISECESHKDKTSLLEIQLLDTKIAYHNLMRDIDDIIKEMHCSLKKS